MKGRYVVPLSKADTGVLYGQAGTYRILIDQKTVGAKNYSMLVNTINAGVRGRAHKHDVNEHCWYILSGTGTVFIEGEAHRVGPQTAVYVPADTMHSVDADEGEDLTYVVIYAPGGPEQKLRTLGAKAFDQVA